MRDVWGWTRRGSFAVSEFPESGSRPVCRAKYAHPLDRLCQHKARCLMAGNAFRSLGMTRLKRFSTLSQIPAESASLGCRSSLAKGLHRPRLMLVGEGAGLDDVGPQRPFQGPSGVMLERMMASIGVRVSDCYTTNVIKCIPPRERNFSIEEIEACRPFLMRQILAVNPRIIIAFGALAAQTILRSRLSISNLRGRLFDFVINDRRIVLVPTFNPAYLLRVPEKKREAWEDLKRVRELMKSGGRGSGVGGQGMEFKL